MTDHKRRPPAQRSAPPPDETHGDFQYRRALEVMIMVAGDDDAGPDDLLEASVHASLATAAYTRDLAAAIKDLAGAVRGTAHFPVDKLAELIGDVVNMKRPS